MSLQAYVAKLVSVNFAVAYFQVTPSLLATYWPPEKLKLTAMNRPNA